ncbi:MAG: 50S ribosomal protein L5 [Bdellovibrionales bacterium CG12_big_fil_rev_8_21_14_0_65_38_15]|nr:MAG: 50S ribosomal protein L5 [Bdellovibrionales bacterium CG22_combo_CG10-13_8_21_14_all_38_13]PIQ55435.1 MAG: 50S ribosomal protein L5 [Bdellovibrionales bacterium CG12_big_fil_rev_8_21_14_0_65_38_15]PIR29176.1 MAG: 50S ribosomal protein L5 [Bdellovibrionales bacterium CG11_big_fil_rev_8_21_14_0_20_38_13]
MKSRLNEMYGKEIKPEMVKKFGYKNINQVPKLEKIIVNSVTRDAVSNGKVVDSIVEDLAAITGQKPVVARAKNSIAGFKLREGMPLGAFVTLRGEKMYEFLDRLINVSLPRVRDFRGVSSKAFDGRGNYTLGMKEQIIFPEINYDKIDKVRGLGISIVTTAKSNEEGRELLSLFGMPFRK